MVLNWCFQWQQTTFSVMYKLNFMYNSIWSPEAVLYLISFKYTKIKDNEEQKL